MNLRTFFARAVALAAIVALAGCAARTDCTQALELADEAARGQQPPGAWIDRVDAACSDARTRARRSCKFVASGMLAPQG